MVLLIRNALIAFLVTVAVAIGFFFWHLEHQLPPKSYSAFLAAVEQGEVRQVHVANGDVTYTDVNGNQYATYSPDVQGLLRRLEQQKIEITAASGRMSPLTAGLVQVLPVLALLVFGFVFFARKFQAGESSEFAARKAMRSSRGRPQVTFDDVAGIPAAKEELLEVVEFLKEPGKFSAIGARIPKGVLLQGPPGTGKTLLARAIAGEAGVPFFSFSGSDFVEMFVGVGASRVRDLFREAKKTAPCIVFIDEIDAVGAHRAAGGAIGGQDERGQTLNALLVEMDGFEPHDTIIVLAATNRPDILDPALLRPGRFDRQITILPPDIKGRMAILEVHARKITLSDNVDLGEVARSTPGFTGADLGNLVNEAALLAARMEKKRVDLSDFEAAKDRILMGVERKGLVISEKDRRTMAHHEAGHAIVARFLPGADPLHKISIIPRGRAMGHTQQLPLDDRHAYSKEYLLNRIRILLGGRAAEEIVLQQQTTGAEDDLLRATELAQKMVCEWGMNTIIGPLAFAQESEGFLGGQAVRRAYSEEMARHIDREIKKIVEQCYEEAAVILRKERYFLEKLAELLLINETLDSEEIDIIFECTQKKLQQLGHVPEKECDICPAGTYCALRSD